MLPFAAEFSLLFCDADVAYGPSRTCRACLLPGRCGGNRWVIGRTLAGGAPVQFMMGWTPPDGIDVPKWRC